MSALYVRRDEAQKIIASWLSVADAAADEGAMRLLGAVTPVPSLIFEVCCGASAMETKMLG
jgi:hypothetical protein